VVMAVCVSVCPSLHYCMDLDVTWGNGKGVILMCTWVDLQSVHRFRCYDNIAPNAKCQ